MKSPKREILQKFRKKLLILLSSLLLFVLLAALFVSKYENEQPLDITTYETLLDNNMIDKAIIGQKYVTIVSQGHSYTIPKDAIDIATLYKKVPVTMQENSQFVIDIISLILLTGVLGYLLYYLRKRQSEPIPIQHQIQIAPVQEPEEFKSNIAPQVSDVTFDDVAGIEEVKEELEEIIDFLKDPQKYTEFGVRMPKGVLLVGPPGVGKTLIAKAVAGEAGVPFFYQSGSAFVQIYVGMGAKRVRELFAKAKEMAPSIVFIDEIDAVGKARGGMRNDEREATLNQLLTEMDGFEPSSGVIVIGATNKIEVLDEALLRPGRFDRRIFVSLPNKEERAKILQIYLKNIPHYVDVNKLADMTVGFSGAALASLVNEAALHALRKKKRMVELSDFEEVKDKVLFGKKKILAFSEKEKEIQSVYQAAKALAAHWYEVEFDKISLIGGTIKELDKEIVSKSDYLARIKVLLAGYVAMQIFYNEAFSNAAQDLARAKQMAIEMVQEYGMGERLYGDIADAMAIIDSALSELQKYLHQHRETIQKIAQELQRKESLTNQEIKELLDALL
ncbi:ATP-dependent metallopeptidase FtsH/Yme1/Tma family protein [Nitratiruptor sp. YY09-18]|uniref:AAA family ATPase n=1 Tax=Nitratiruptor sp. YY09-18 TaxID=2724901 RepID=UPI001915F423